MDFKSLMSAQIAKSKPPSKSTTSSTTTTLPPSTNKYQRRADLEKEREAAYAAEQARIESEREERLAKKRKLEDEEAERSAQREEKKRRLAEESRVRREAEEADQERKRRKRLGLPELVSSKTAGDEEEELPDVPDDELRARLRELKEPESTGTGEDDKTENETHEARLARYYKLIGKTFSATKKNKKRIWYPGPIPTTIEPLPTDEIMLPATPPPESDTKAYIHLHRQISTYLNFLLTEWSAALAARSKDDSTSSAGVQASNNYKQVLADLTPLMRRLEAGVDNPPSTSQYTPSTTQNTHPTQTTTQKESETKAKPLPFTPLLQPLVQILNHIQNRHYRTATNAYLRLSIGKAAWPIGVTMVGIHERSAREKLHEDGKDREVAQIMADEGTRRWLQSLKRCVSFAQSRWEVWELGELMG